MRKLIADFNEALRVWLNNKVFKHQSLPVAIKTVGRLFIPIFGIYVGKNSAIIGENFFSRETLITLMLLIAAPFLLYIADLFEKKAPTLKKLKALSIELREIVNFYPTYSEKITIDIWKQDVQSFLTALEHLVSLVISDLTSTRVPAIERKYHIACNLMIYVRPEIITEEQIRKLLDSLDDNLQKERDLYFNIDADKSIEAYLLMVGMSTRSIERDYSPSFIKVFEDPRETYPGAPLLIHDALVLEENKGHTNMIYIKNVEQYDEFGSLVSKAARIRFKDIFKNKQDFVKSFASLPIYWDGLLIGCLNIESHVPNFLDFKLDRSLEYTLNVVRPIAEVFAYEFNNNFI